MTATYLRSAVVDDRPVGELLQGAAGGDGQCWKELVDRYSRLVWKVISGFNLDRASAEDVSQTVWLRLAEHCSRIREPDRLAGWLATTATNEAVRVARGRQRLEPQESINDAAQRTDAAVDDRMLGFETLAEVLEAFKTLDADSQQLLRLLCVVPPLDYRTISELTGRPIGSIGPTRQRILQRLRRQLPAESDDQNKEGRR